MSKAIADQLSRSLGLGIAPIAVTFTDDLPDGMEGPAAPVAAGCSFWERAADGAFVTGAEDHALCSIGIHTHNLSGAPPTQMGELKRTLEVLGQLDYVRPEEVPNIPVCESSRKHVVYAPLSDAPLAADVVVLFAHARHSLIVTEAVSQVENGAPPAMGRPACAMIPQVMNSKRAAMSLGCCGARAYLDALTDDIALWALPGKSIAAYADRIEALASANATLTQFHTKRRASVEGGARPTVDESLAALG